jgi:hypothetical protein
MLLRHDKRGVRSNDDNGGDDDNDDDDDDDDLTDGHGLLVLAVHLEHLAHHGARVVLTRTVMVPLIATWTMILMMMMMMMIMMMMTMMTSPMGTASLCLLCILSILHTMAHALC